MRDEISLLVFPFSGCEYNFSIAEASNYCTTVCASHGFVRLMKRAFVIALAIVLRNETT